MTDPSRILIATPLDGNEYTAHLTAGYHHAVRQLERAGAVTLAGTLCFQDDLARARSRCVWYALTRSTWDYLLFWDDDVVPSDMSIVPRMVDRANVDGHDVLGAPYPRKRIKACFPYKPIDMSRGQLYAVNDCIEVDYLAIGFMLLSRKCLTEMVEFYADEWFTDRHEAGNEHETIGLFRQVMTSTIVRPDGKRHRDLLSEDYSFCHRWRAMGGKVQMYVGPGAPVGHVGGHVFTADNSEIGHWL